MRYRFSNVITHSGLKITQHDEGFALLGPVSIACDWEDEHQRVLSVTIEAANTAHGPEAKSLTIKVNEPDDRLLTDDLRVPIDRILGAGMQGAVVKVDKTPTGRRYTPIEDPSEERIVTARSRRRTTDTVNSVTIAADYRHALDEGIHPTAYIMKKHNVSRSTAARLVRKARDDKELGEAIPGRAGEKPLIQDDAFEALAR